MSVDDLPDEDRTRCEVWTRVMGYHRPVSAFNDGKGSEHRERRYFREAPGWEQYDLSRGVEPLTRAGAQDGQ